MMLNKTDFLTFVILREGEKNEVIPNHYLVLAAQESSQGYYNLIFNY